MLKKISNWKGILVLILLLVHNIVVAQFVTGRITDENNVPLPYVNIGIPGLNRGTISSLDGTFQVDISDVDGEQVVRFSAVGYESIDFKIADIIAKLNCQLDLKLKKRVIMLKEVVVRPKNTEPTFLGSRKKGIYTCVWNNANKGAEIGTLFTIDKPVFLNTFLFHVKTSNCDSIHYRLRIYDGRDKNPDLLINTEDIRFISKVRKGWESINLSSYNITLENNFIVTLETLKFWPGERKCINHLSVRNTDAQSFTKESSMAKWTQFGDQMSFRFEVKEY